LRTSDHEDSNFGNANKVLFSVIDIPAANIHRIDGENDPEAEAERYSKHILQCVPSKSGMPIFDWIFLGVGEDGHTASIFPNQIELINSSKICAVSKHPDNDRCGYPYRNCDQYGKARNLYGSVRKQEVVKILSLTRLLQENSGAKIVLKPGRVECISMTGCRSEMNDFFFSPIYGKDCIRIPASYKSLRKCRLIKDKNM
jgi:hypothetical protein